MPTLDAMFKLHDGYSKQLNKMMSLTDKMSSKVVSTSGKVDKMDKVIAKTGHNTSGIDKATKSIGKLLSITALTVGAIKGMGIADEFINTKARLDIMNDGLQTTAELQDKIMQSANRAKGSYTDMAGSIAKMGILAGENFDSNNEVIAFTELVQKSFKVGGAGTQEQQSGMYQLTQAMAAGKLQGDEFRSIMENAPLIAEAIAKYTGKSKGDLKEMSSDGVITADIIKGAMFYMADDINDKFESMPKTFGDIWNRIKNGAIAAFTPVITKVNELINTEGFDSFVDIIIDGFNLIAIGLSGIINGFIWFGQVVQENWSIVQPVLIALGATLFALFAMTLVNLGRIAIGWMVGFWPITLVIGLLAILIGWVMHFGDSFITICEVVSGGVSVLWAVFNNLITGVVNMIYTVFNTVDNIITGVVNMAISGINLLIEQLNKLPGVSINALSKFEGLIKDGLEVEYMGLGDAWDKGKAMGNDFGTSTKSGIDSLANMTQGMFDKLTTPMGMDAASGFDMSDFMVDGAMPITEPKGKKLKVNMDKEDIKYIKDLAERDYIAKFSTATLAPQVSIQFGDVHETADANKIAKTVERVLREEIAVIAEG